MVEVGEAIRNKQQEKKGVRQFYKWDDICFQLIMMTALMNIKWLAFVSGRLRLATGQLEGVNVTQSVKQMI